MELFVDPGRMRAWSRAERARGHTIAVVPTMGALHRGHLALIEIARAHADQVIVTIFVNPLQFDRTTDFDAYPRPIDDDVLVCRRHDVDAVYAPTAATMYPAGFETHVAPGTLADRLEGAMRPGHFRGVATVVTKLCGATVPDHAVFGQKDYQQLAIVRRLAIDLDLGVDVVGVPTVREPDGLACSSRNLRLAPDDRTAATVISRGLAAAGRAYAAGERTTAVLGDLVTATVTDEPLATLEYVEVVDAVDLTVVDRVISPVVVLVAAWFGGVRLIDNLVLDDGLGTT